MQTARIPPVDPAPATITAVLAMHTGHICPSFELLIAVFAHEIKLAQNVEMPGVTSVAGF